MTDHVPATAEGLSNITRRNVLLGLAGAAPAIAVSTPTVASEVAEQAENPALVAAWKKFRDAETEFYAADEALEWLVDEWRHVWPRAPRSVHWNGTGGVPETDLAGHSLRDEQGHVVFLRTPELLKDYHDWAQSGLRPLRSNASEKVRLRRRGWQRRLMIEVQEAEAYFKEIERIRRAAGAEAAHARRKAADEKFLGLAAAVSHETAKTNYGLRLKADALIGVFDRYKIKSQGYGFVSEARRLADTVLELTAHLDREGA